MGLSDDSHHERDSYILFNCSFYVIIDTSPHIINTDLTFIIQE